MVYRLVCEMSDRIAGAAPFGGAFGIKNTEKQNCRGIVKFKAGEAIDFSKYRWNQDLCEYENWKKFPEYYSCD